MGVFSWFMAPIESATFCEAKIVAGSQNDWSERKREAFSFVNEWRSKLACDNPAPATKK